MGAPVSMVSMASLVTAQAPGLGIIVRYPRELVEGSSQGHKESLPTTALMIPMFMILTVSGLSGLMRKRFCISLSRFLTWNQQVIVPENFFRLMMEIPQQPSLLGDTVAPGPPRASTAVATVFSSISTLNT